MKALVWFLSASIVFTFNSFCLVLANESKNENFVIFGDAGKDNEGQLQVSQAMQKVCSLEKCNYGFLLGDNIYEEGMSAEDDPIIETMFDKYYNALNIPFFIALGNHDYGKYSNAWEKGAFEMGHAKENPLFVIPNYFYIQETENIVLLVLDTTRMMWSKDLKPQAELAQQAYQLAKQKNKWFIVTGHHPYLSNGHHGNAGHYDKVSFPAFISGTDVKKFFDNNICGKADIYFSGHDHNLQLTDGNIANCNTLLVVSGGAASTEDFVGKNSVLYQADILGFLLASFTANSAELRVYNSQSEVTFTKVVNRVKRPY